MKVQKFLHDKEIEILEIDDILLRNEEDLISGERKIIAEYHADYMNEYFDDAESQDNLDVFWSKDSAFYKLFKKLNTEIVVELACGRGRHVPHYLNNSSRITLVDILEKNIDICRQRFKDEEKISYYINNGYDLSEIPSESQTALFTYDAMVHFEMFDIYKYLKETYRILKKGGRALFHHSNNTQDYKITFLTGISGRNYMSMQLFAFLANRAGLTILEQQVIDWGGNKELDCITLLEKE